MFLSSHRAHLRAVGEADAELEHTTVLGDERVAYVIAVEDDQDPAGKLAEHVRDTDWANPAVVWFR